MRPAAVQCRLRGSPIRPLQMRRCALIFLVPALVLDFRPVALARVDRGRKRGTTGRERFEIRVPAVDTLLADLRWSVDLHPNSMQRDGSRREDPLHTTALSIPLPPIWVYPQLKDDAVVDAIAKQILWSCIPPCCPSVRRAIHTWLPEIVPLTPVVGLQKHARIQHRPHRVPPGTVEGSLPILAASNHRFSAIPEDHPPMLILVTFQCISQATCLEPQHEERLEVEARSCGLGRNGASAPGLGDLAPLDDEILASPPCSLRPEFLQRPDTPRLVTISAATATRQKLRRDLGRGIFKFSALASGLLGIILRLFLTCVRRPTNRGIGILGARGLGISLRLYLLTGSSLMPQRLTRLGTANRSIGTLGARGLGICLRHRLTRVRPANRGIGTLDAHGLDPILRLPCSGCTLSDGISAGLRTTRGNAALGDYRLAKPRSP
mmetsp:Transcript_85732/g.276678  ORF Transcript_85732/g.276678 Transcript_85732/m.276678 type:complete len:436 (-) Transcript_85732:79-1386(-)